jgi:hypothetical protein
VKVYFGAYGPHSLSIVRANELGVDLITYYRKVISLGGKYPGIEMGRLPKGIELLAQIDVVIENPDESR